MSLSFVKLRFNARSFEVMNVIPKVIHYCWFGGNDLGEDEIRCIDSWRRFLPDYEIKRWDETNWDVHCCEYVSEAYDAKQWAFVSDYARFDILYKHGGLYFDTDVELIKPIDDILAKGPFMGFETDYNPSGGPTVAAGLGLSANPGLDLYKDILDSYVNNHFVKDDGSFNQTTVVARVTEVLFEKGLKRVSGVQKVASVTIYPAEYFNPMDFLTGIISITENTRSIHHFGMSWFDEKRKFEYNAGKWLRTHGIVRGCSVLAALLTTIRFMDVERIRRKLIVALSDGKK